MFNRYWKTDTIRLDLSRSETNWVIFTMEYVARVKKSRNLSIRDEKKFCEKLRKLGTLRENHKFFWEESQ